MKTFQLLYKGFFWGLGLSILIGLSACDDAPESPASESAVQQKKSSKELLRRELKKEALREQSKETRSLTLKSFEMQQNGQAVELSADEQNKIVKFGMKLCRAEGDTHQAVEKIKESSKEKYENLVSQLKGMGYESVSIKIIMGSGDSAQEGQQQEIQIDIHDGQHASSCTSYGKGF